MSALLWGTLAVLVDASVETASRVPLIIDTDTALSVAGLHDIDDDLAILFALAHPSAVELLGVVATFGNAHSNETYADAVSLAREAGLDPLKVAQGGDFGDSLTVQTNGTELMHKLIVSSDQPVTVLCIGSMFTLAAVVTQYPSVVDRIGHVVMMGGSSGTGPPIVQSAGDLNFYADPAAVNVLMGLDVKKTVGDRTRGCSLTVSHNLWSMRCPGDSDAAVYTSPIHPRPFRSAQRQ
jgi:inosine-uridine nucleoside N-ribohydrolase